jgi:hypothetical protein
LEFAQRLTHYRTFEVADMGANTVGVLLGWIASPRRGPNLIGFVERVLSSFPSPMDKRLPRSRQSSARNSEDVD